jgi:uncharacterized protein (TIGR03437 family)
VLVHILKGLCGLLLLLSAPLLRGGTVEKLTGFQISPARLRTVSSGANVTAEVQLQSGGTGLVSGYVSLVSSSGRQEVTGVLNPIPIAGLPQSGSFRSSMMLPQYAEEGTWQVSAVGWRDSLGTLSIVSGKELAAAGYNTWVTVESASDITPPAVLRMTVPATVLIPIEAAPSVLVEFSSTDDRSGLSRGWVMLQSPSGRQYATESFGPTSLGGTPLNGVYRFNVTLPVPTETGAWRIFSLSLTDAAGNSRVYGATELQTLGAPSAITTSSTRDTSPPRLVSIQLTPTEGSSSLSAELFQVRLRITDDISGFASGTLEAASVLGAQRVTATIVVVPSPGTLKDGEFRAVIAVPRKSQTGAWQVASVTLRDVAGNSATIQNADLQAVAGSRSFNVDGGILASYDPSPAVVTATIDPLRALETQRVTLSSHYYTKFPVRVMPGPSWVTLNPPSQMCEGSCSMYLRWLPELMVTGVQSGLVPLSVDGSHIDSRIPIVVTSCPRTPYRVDPAEIRFDYFPGLALPAAQTVRLSGGENWPYSLFSTTVSPWVSITPKRGTSPSALQIAVNPQGLVSGDYTAKVAFNPDAPCSGAAALSVRLTVHPQPQVWSDVSASELQYVTGRQSALTDTITIRSEKPAAVSITTNGNPWLQAEPAAGITPLRVRLRIEPGGLTLGRHDEQLTIRTPEASQTLFALPLRVEVSQQGLPSLTPNGAVNAASFLPAAVPGSWISVFGSQFTDSSRPGRTWTSGEIIGGVLPTQLDGTGVRIAGKAAAISYLSSGQLNIQVPDVERLGSVPIEVFSAAGTTQGVLELLPIGPALFVHSLPGGPKFAAAIYPDGTPVGDARIVSSARPAQPGETVLLYGTGFGRCEPHQPAGHLVTPSPLASPFLVRIGGQTATASFGGIVAPGLYQFNVVIPPLPAGDHAVEIEIAGLKTQEKTVITVGGR